MKFERPEIIRPPSESRSYYLPLTSGCSNNSCAFCSWNGCKLQIREQEDIKKEIDALALYMKSKIRLPDIPQIVYNLADYWDGKRIFLQDGDALVYPMTKLQEILQYLNEKLPDLDRVASYATPQDLQRNHPEDLKRLKDLKLGIVYMGVESGNDDVLQRIGKGVNSRQMMEAGKKARSAGILLSVSVILGLGEIEKSRQHALDTARVLSEIDPEYVGALTLTLVPGTPLYDDWRQKRFITISPFQSIEELKLMIEGSNFTGCFFSSMHASNYFSIRGMLPADKSRMLMQLEHILSSKNQALLRPEFLRGL